MLLHVGNVRTIFSVMERLNKITMAVIKQVNACDVSGKEGMYGQLAMVECSTGCRIQIRKRNQRARGYFVTSLVCHEMMYKIVMVDTDLLATSILLVLSSVPELGWIHILWVELQTCDSSRRMLN